LTPFALDPRLEADSLPVTDLSLSAVRLMRDANYPWLILVPRRPAAAELLDLAPEDRHLLMDEICRVSHALRSAVQCDKLNIGALGNIVRQLHVHVVARRRTDPAWPGPIWGAAPRRPYAPGEEEAFATVLAAALR